MYLIAFPVTLFCCELLACVGCFEFACVVVDFAAFCFRMLLCVVFVVGCVVCWFGVCIAFSFAGGEYLVVALLRLLVWFVGC